MGDITVTQKNNASFWLNYGIFNYLTVFKYQTNELILICTKPPLQQPFLVHFAYHVEKLNYFRRTMVQRNPGKFFILFSINLTTSLMIKLNISYWLQLTKTKPQTFLYIWKATLKTRNIWLTISVEYSSVHNLDILLSKLQKTTLVWNETIANPIHLPAWVQTNQRKCKLFNAMLVVWITSS